MGYKLKKGKNKITVFGGSLLDIDTSNIFNWKQQHYDKATFDLCYHSLNALLSQIKCTGEDDLREWYKYERDMEKKSKQIINDDYELDMNNLNTELKEYQKKAIAYFMAIRRCYLALDMGLGKVQPVTNKVLTENGWIEIGKLNIGDKIYNSKGTLSNVVGIFPQGIIKNYEVVFTDGSKTNCGEEHLWNVQTPNHRKKYPEKFITKTLKELMNEGIKTKHYHKRDKREYYNNKWFIPMIKPIQWKSVQHIIHPYNLGLLIGDGSILHTVNLCNIDKEIQNKFIKLANCKVNRVTDDLVVLNENPYKFELQRLNLWGHKSPEKFIPNEYLHDSIENRIHLLQGLMDTDGTVQGSNVSYSTKSLQLAKDIRYLVQSLGGTSRINNKIVKGETYYNINVQLPCDIVPFTTQYHLNRYTSKTKYNPYRAIKEVNYINDCEGVCIKTDAEDSLYVTDDFILTHNTLIALNIIKALKANKVLIICPAYLKFNWEEEIKKWTPELSYSLVKGNPDERESCYQDFIKNNKKILIINYEQARVNIKENNIETNIHPYVQKTLFDLIIWDESHRLKTPTSQTFKGSYAIQSKNALMLSGTPTSKNGVEIFANLKILDKNRFTSQDAFTTSLFRMIKTDYGIKIGTCLNPKRFRAITQRYMLRMIKKDVAPQLPDKVFVEIPVEMEEKQQNIYNRALEDYLKPCPIEGEDLISSDVEKFIRLNQITQNPYILDDKLDCSVIRDTTIELLNDLGDKQIMIGCMFIKMSENLCTSIKKKFKGRNVYLINSKIKDRTLVLSAFKNDKTGILITTVKCLKEGVSIDSCDNIILADIDWNCGNNQQFFDRIHRITSTRKKTYYQIFVKGTVSEYKYLKIQKEQNESNMLLGDEPNVIITTLSEMFKEDIIKGRFKNG